MFENLTDKLERSFKILKGEGRITEINVAETLKEIRRALIDADVNYKVAKTFTDEVKQKALGQDVLKAVKPGQMMTKIVRDELAELMGGTATDIRLEGTPAVILIAGLQGSGKTTFSGKLASLLKSKKGRQVLLVAGDVYRPAAIDQLKVLGGQIGVEVYTEEGNRNPVEIAENGIKYARQKNYNVVIVDTAGRLAVDEAMMQEITAIKAAVKPSETLFVVDAMTGQDAVNTAREFNERLDFDGVVLTKLDGDTRGGAAISIRSVVNKPLKFISSGVDFDGNEIRKGAADAMQSYVTHAGGMYSPDCDRVVKSIASKGGTPLVVAKNHKILGVIYLKDIIKQGVKEKFADLRKMGIKTIMITGDNPITAAAIAAEAGVDDFLAEATPEGKLAMIRDFQAKGHLVAMTGDGTNDAPALAQADVAVAMNSGTQAAKEAGNMVDLDSSPTKLIDIVRIGKQLLMTRGSLTTFSIANDVAKYFAIIPALFMGLYPGLSALNIMGLHSPQSAVLSAIIYNALIIIALIPLALKGVKYREVPAGKLLSRNLLVYGLGGLAAPFIFVKLIDVLLVFTGLV